MLWPPAVIQGCPAVAPPLRRDYLTGLSIFALDHAHHQLVVLETALIATSPLLRREGLSDEVAASFAKGRLVCLISLVCYFRFKAVRFEAFSLAAKPFYCFD